MFLSLKIGFININSVCNKISFIYDLLRNYNVDILALAETWLVSSIPSSFVDVPGYVVCRRDVGGCVRKHGVCVYLRESLNFAEVESGLENVLVVQLVDLQLYVVVVYRPPSYSSLQNERLVEFLLEFIDGKEVLLLGDFNLPSLVWREDGGDASHSVPLDRSFLDCFEVLGLTQHVTVGTFYPSGNVLDLVLTSDPDRLSSLEVLEPLPGCGHCPIILDYLFQFGLPLESSHPRRSWFRGDYVRLNALLRDVDWFTEFGGLSVDEMYLRFLALLGDFISICVPMASQRTRSLPWMSKPPRSLATRRSQLWNDYKNARSTHGRSSAAAVGLLEQYKSVNSEYRSFALTKQSQYEFDLIIQKSDRPKLFHSYIRQKKIGKPRVGPLRESSGQIISDSRNMAECFASSFSSVYSTDVLVEAAAHQVSDGNITDIEVTPGIVCAVLSSLDVSSSMGPDDVHPAVLKECSSSLAFPLTMLFRESIRVTCLPNLWKHSLVVPIYKKGVRSDPLNYRPIGLTSVVCKVLERVIYKSLYNYLEDHTVLSSDQYGFRRGRSTEDQLLLVYDRVTSWIDKGYTVDVVLFDFAKAFDVVNHQLLLEKLSLLGVGGSLLGWLRQFLVGRVMQVVVGGGRSVSHSVCSGVPQGSVLGPLLFNIFVNHLSHGLLSHCKIFADDLKLYFPLRGPAGMNSPGQRDIDSVYRTALSWGLRLNISKCSILRFGPSSSYQLHPRYVIGGYALPLVPFSQDLGVTVDQSLRFHKHIGQVVGKAAGLAANLLRSTCNRQPQFMRELFITHIRPVMDYSSCIWNTGYVGDLHKLESVQRRWTKNVSGFDEYSYSRRLRELDLFSIKGRLIRADLIKVWKIFHGKSPIGPVDIFSLSPHVRTRGHPFKLSHERCRLDARQRFFSVRVVPLWNSLPEEVVLLDSLDLFKRGLRHFLGDLLFSYEE